MMLENNIYSDKKELFEQQLKAGLVPKEATAFIRDTKQIWNNGCYFGGESKFIVKITYNELVDLKSSGNLIAGTKYRIIDYETLTSQPGTKSAEHPFDIVVTALDSSTLDENARAMISRRDVDGYFSTSKLNAWKIKYSLNNNKDRFAWTKLEEPSIVVNAKSFGMGYLHAFLNGTYIYNGKTYYMWNYGYDDEVFLSEKENPSVGDKVLVCLLSEGQDAGVTLTISQIPERQEAGKGVIYHMIDEFGNDCPYDFKNIQFKHPKDTTTYPDYYYTFSTVINGVVTDHSLLQGYCYDNIMKDYINSGKHTLNCNVFLITLKTSSCSSNSFEYGCHSNSFGNDCQYNSFGNYCYNNSFGDSYRYNSFGDYCNSNSFGSDFQNNSFGDKCIRNSFGDSYSCNSFGNNCLNNSLGSYYYGNSFGNGFSANSFGNDCQYNSFGNCCQYNSFRTSASETATLLDYCYYNHFDDGCSYNVIWNSDTTRDGNALQNINVNRGVSGISSNYNYINIDTLNAGYEIQVAKNSKGEIKIYCEADLIA